MKLPNSKTTAMPDSKTTALPDSLTTAQHGHSLLTYCEDAEWSHVSHQLVAETEVRIFDPGAFDGVEFIHVEPDKISEDVLDGDLASQIEESKSIQSTATQSSNEFNSLAASMLFSTFEIGRGDETALSHGKERNGLEDDEDYIQPGNTVFLFVPDSTEWCQDVRLDGGNGAAEPDKVLCLTCDNNITVDGDENLIAEKHEVDGCLNDGRTPQIPHQLTTFDTDTHSILPRDNTLHLGRITTIGWKLPPD